MEWQKESFTHQKEDIKVGWNNNNSHSFSYSINDYKWNMARIKTERIKMDIDDILKNLQMDEGNPNGIYLREIALLM